MPDRFRVLIIDVLDEASVESPVLGDMAELARARAHLEGKLIRSLNDFDAHALIIFHDVALLPGAAFAAAHCRVAVRAGVG